MKKGVSQVTATILMLIITIALAGMAYMYIAGVFEARTEPEEKEIDCRILERVGYDYCETVQSAWNRWKCCCYYHIDNKTYALDRCYEIEEK